MTVDISMLYRFILFSIRNFFNGEGRQNQRADGLHEMLANKSYNIINVFLGNILPRVLIIS